MHGTVAYCAQQPWILTETIRGNVLFGNAINQERLDTVLGACALKNDIAQFAAGDLTQIGEKGINLSGGQKARVALARAMYQDTGKTCSYS